jgi:hypothetical protein
MSVDVFILCVLSCVLLQTLRCAELPSKNPDCALDEASETVAKVQLKGCRAVSNNSAFHIPSLISLLVSGLRGRLNLKWLRHYATNRKVVGSIPHEVTFSIYLILPAALRPRVYSAHNRNEFHKHKDNNVSGE